MQRFIKDYWGVLFLLMVFAALFFLASAPLGDIPLRQFEGALPGVLTATVSINPLFVMLLSPDNPIADKPFTLEVSIENRGEARIEDLKARLHLPSGISLLGGREERNVGALSGHKGKTVLWRLKTSTTGSYVIVASAIGQVAGTNDTISSNGSIVVEVGEATPKGEGIFFLFPRYLQMLLNMLP